MSKQKKKILFGAVDIGWRIEHYSKFITENFGNELIPESFVKFKLPEEHYKTNYTHSVQYHKYPKIIQWIISFSFFIYSLYRYDVFYFLSGETILTRKLLPFELMVYKILNKKLVMHFVGTDIRNADVLYWRNNYTEQFLNNKIELQPKIQTDFQIKICRLSEKYADKIIVSTPDLLEFFENKIKVEFLPVFIDKEKFINEYDLITNSVKKEKNTKEVTILHAPSNTKVKGTEYIRKVLNEIKKIYQDVDIIITDKERYNKNKDTVYTVTRYDLLKLYRTADIVIDQVLIGWYGLQTVESILLEKATICYIDKELNEYLPKNIPLYKCEESLKSSIIEAIEQIKKGKIFTNNDFVEDNHIIENSNFEKIIKKLINDD